MVFFGGSGAGKYLYGHKDREKFLHYGFLLVFLDYCFHKLMKKLMETYCGYFLVSIHDFFFVTL